jgi:hypothetical protein
VPSLFDCSVDLSTIVARFLSHRTTGRDSHNRIARFGRLSEGGSKVRLEHAFRFLSPPRWGIRFCQNQQFANTGC